MKFCPDCGKKLGLIQINEKNEKKAFKYKCSKCDYTDGNSPITQQIKTFKANKKEETIVVIDKDNQKYRTTPTQIAECPKCFNNLAEIWQVQTRSGDEGATQFFRCTKCDYTWRLYT